jgi:hypothetical protein
MRKHSIPSVCDQLVLIAENQSTDTPTIHSHLACFEQSNPDPIVKVGDEHCSSVFELVQTIAFKSAATVIVSHNGSIGLR